MKILLQNQTSYELTVEYIAEVDSRNENIVIVRVVRVRPSLRAFLSGVPAAVLRSK